MQPHVSKDALRRSIKTLRSAVPEAEAVTENAARTRLLLQALGDTPRTVALYASRPDEPGTREAINQLHDDGWQVLLPLPGASPGWALFKGWSSMRTGWGGIPAPEAPADNGPALDIADFVVVACLAVSRDGTRLGTGGGWYDRALPQRRRGAPVWALARTQELMETLPTECHDVPVDMVFTPDGAYTCGEADVPDIGKPWPSPLA